MYALNTFLRVVRFIANSIVGFIVGFILGLLAGGHDVGIIGQWLDLK